jgi:hypothetical protein
MALGSVLSTWFRERVGDGKGRVRRIAIVALARKLLVALWRYLGLVWSQLAPCSRRADEALAGGLNKSSKQEE